MNAIAQFPLISQQKPSEPNEQNAIDSEGFLALIKLDN
jgi:hypothetical protein